MARLQSRLPASLYVAGPFAMGYTEFYNFLIPLYGLSLGMSAGQIGMLVGARSLLAVFLSIHVGVLMDRLGTRRVALFFVWTAMAMAPVFPLLPWFRKAHHLCEGAAVEERHLCRPLDRQAPRRGVPFG